MVWIRAFLWMSIVLPPRLVLFFAFEYFSDLLISYRGVDPQEPHPTRFLDSLVRVKGGNSSQGPNRSNQSKAN